jgi:S1-C subfamily serine protease
MVRAHTPTMLGIIAALVPFLAAQRPHQPTPSEIFNNAKRSVVLILGAGQEGIEQGSGFIQGQDQVVTNFHVVEAQEQLYVKFADGDIALVKSVAQGDKNIDLAILEVPTGSRPPLPMGDELALHEGDSVLALGAPRGLELTLTNGIVSSFRRDENSFLIQTTAAIAPGSSGGPLLDSRGRVVGITAFRLSDSPGLYFSVAVSELKRLLKTASTRALGITSNTDELEALRREIESGSVEAASTRANTLLSRDPNNPTGLAIKGILALHQNHPEEAVRFLSRAVNKQPDLELPQSYYSLALIRTGDFKRALVHARKAEEIASTEFSQQTLALAAYLLNDLSTAKKSAEQVLATNEDDETALEILTGVAYWENPGAPTWLARAKEVKKLDPSGSWALILDWHEGNRDVQKLESAKSARFPNEVPFLILASNHLYSSSGADFKAAANELTPALASMPENSRLLRTVVFVDLLRKDFRSAAEHFSTLQNSTADPVEVHAAGCLYYMAVGQSRIALDECKAGVDANPNNSTAHSNYGWAALDADKFRLALLEFSKARDLAQSAKPTMLHSVDLLWGLLLANWWVGNETEAKRLYDALLPRGKQYTEVSELKKLPFLWSKKDLVRIQAANDKWHK